MENMLIMNKLPLPKYYDGYAWNTHFKPTRKSIPKYLHEDLPELKLLQLKEQFKQIGKFNCPKLEYFNDFIKKKNIAKQNKKNKNQKAQTARKSYEQVKQELQYALLICDRESSVLDNLVEKAKSIKKIGINQKSMSPGKQDKGRYFDGTIDLVFRNRKNLYLTQVKNKNETFNFPAIQEKVDQIKLLPFDNQ